MRNIHYENGEHFKKESKYFNSDWLFICLKSQVTENNSFVTLKNFYHNIVVQNFRGELVALSNICVHRFNTIQDDLEGKRPLVCKYHSWGYDKSGKTRSHKSACLEKYEVGICGDFVFINIKNKTSLEDYLGTFYSYLQNISSLFDSTNSNNILTLTHSANWKFLVENVLECYHCPSVHQESLGDIGLGHGIPFNHILYDKHDSIEYPIIEENKKKNSKGMRFFENRNYCHQSYKHFYIAPNLFISSTEGLFFYIGRLDPISKKKTNLQVMFRISLFNSNINKNMIKHLYDVSSVNSINILKEDKVILERQQTNMKYTPNQEAIITKDEPRISNFHKNYNSILNN